MTDRTFDFLSDEATSFAVPIPATSSRAAGANALPFAAWFDKWADKATAGEQPHLFVPKAFWTARADKPEDVDVTYQKGKLRDQFRKWKMAHPEATKAVTKPAPGGKGVVIETPATSPLDTFSLSLVARTGKEEGFEEEGLSMWLLHPAPATEAPTAEGKKGGAAKK